MAKKALELGVSLKDRIDSFATDCGWNSSVKNVLIKGLQAIGVGAAIGTAAAVATEAGLVAGLTAGAGIFIAGEATAKATDLSAEAAVTYAISQADTEEEAQSYADLVISMVEWGLIGLSTVGAYKWVKGKAPALRNTFSKAKISELFGLSRAKKAGVTASVSEASASVGMIEKTFTKAEMKELLASKSNDNIFLVNDNGIYMSKGKVVNGESVGVGRVSETFSAEPTGRQREIKTSLFLRKGENPSKRPTWRQSEIDDTIRYRKAGYAVEPQVSFLNGKRCKNGISDSIRVDNYVEGLAAVEIKNYNLTTNSGKLVSNIVEQAIKHQKHLPEGTRQIFKIDARGQACTRELERSIRTRITEKCGHVLSPLDIDFIRE